MELSWIFLQGALISFTGTHLVDCISAPGKCSSETSYQLTICLPQDLSLSPVLYCVDTKVQTDLNHVARLIHRKTTNTQEAAKALGKNCLLSAKTSDL